MKKTFIRTTARVIGPQETRTINGNTYTYYPVELPGGWQDRVLCRDYDTLTVGDTVSVSVYVYPVDKENVRQSVILCR